ncbi:MAG: nitroreductase [Lachnospiraceae bacterium]|nr:nitroreductase [Lachnospiraceae bacterium]
MENVVLKSLEERRSIRKFKETQVEEEALQAILRAGTYAPTGMNKQAPIMVVVQDKETIEKLRKMNAAVMGNPDADPFYGAPTIVIVLADRNVSTHVEDGSLVMGNLMNAAYAVGVDSCWIHRAKQEFESEEGKELLDNWGIKGDYVGVGHCILGYRDCEWPEKRARKDNYIYRV